MRVKRTELIARAIWQAWWVSIGGKPAEQPQVAIYALCCPLTKEVRYVGQSNDPHSRLADHLSSRAMWNVKQWVWQLKAKKLEAVQITIAFVNQSEADEQEKFWINYFRERVKLLLNSKHHRKYISSWEIQRSFDPSREDEGPYLGYPRGRVGNKGRFNLTGCPPRPQMGVGPGRDPYPPKANPP